MIDIEAKTKVYISVSDDQKQNLTIDGNLDLLDRFLKMIRNADAATAVAQAVAEERERCAGIAASFRIGCLEDDGTYSVSFMCTDTREIAARIRARGNP